jgi:hypothetical protein
MSDKETDIWEYYADPPPKFLLPETDPVPRFLLPETEQLPLVDRLKNTGPARDENNIWTGRFPSWQDAHEAAILIERLEQAIQEREETIRYLTNELSKTL